MVLGVADRAASAVEWVECLGRTEMARYVAEFDWARTPLGPIAEWSQGLKSAVVICLRTPFPMAVYWGPSLTCIYNDAARDVIGQLHPGALGLPARELLSDSWNIVGPQLEAALHRGESGSVEDQPLTLNRRGRLEVSFFTYSYSPLLDDDGTVGGVLHVSNDTTTPVLAKRRADAVRQLSTECLGAVSIEQACVQSCRALTRTHDVPVALVYLLDEAGKRATCVAAHWGAQPMTPARPVIELAAARDPVGRHFSDIAAGTTDGLVDASLFVPDPVHGRPPAEAVVLPLPSGSGDRAAGFIVLGVRDDLVFDQAYAEFTQLAAETVARSVAAARGLELERQRVTDIAALDRSKTALFGNASHELRTPLALIISHLEQLQEQGGLATRSDDALRVVHRSAVRMLKLVNALLDFSRIEAGQTLGVLEPTDVGTLTAEIAAMFQSAAERAGLRFVVDCPPLAEPACIDQDAWERIVSNLISNALKFTREGRVCVSTRVRHGQLHLTVDDTGIGIAPEELSEIFNRFYRSPDPRAHAHEGSGIGLALVRELVHLHGGSVQARNRTRGGTRMTVRIPLITGCADTHRGTPSGRAFAGQRVAELFVAEAEGWFDPSRPRAFVRGSDEEPDPESRARPPGAAPDRARVLVAEDDCDMREYLRRLLSPHFCVQLARDGGEAQQLALQDPPSVLISDVMMPGLDGFGLIHQLRSAPLTRDVPVILLSARADPESTLMALDLGADDYIIKPFGAPELLARVRTTLRNSRGRSAAAAARGRFEERVRHEGELRALLADLRAAQRRVAAAGDAERRRIERDLHDGAQQRLMALRLELTLLSERLEANPAAATERLRELRHELDEALEELRELAHGLYPSLLASDGLEAALAATAVRSPIPVTVEATGITRAPRSIESAAYFCCLEALQNAIKHAGPGASAVIELQMRHGFLEFAVRDDGAGFDQASVRPGHGLINLRDRLEALGGHTSITSAPGIGTTVAGHLPLP